MKRLFFLLILITILPLPLHAQEDTKISELVTSNQEVKASEIEELEKQEDERTQQIANLLGFILPEYTDNPSYVITFKDPSPEKNGVEIELDGKPFAKINSPYTFPALSIGKHTVKFRFYDKDGNVQLLNYDFTVIPRAPIINSPVMDSSSITIGGTALSNSEILYTLIANTYNETGIAYTNEDGNWSITLTPEGGLSEGIYTFMAYARKYGYASNLSTPVTFGLGENPDRFVVNNHNDIYFSFKDLSKENLFNTFSKFPDLIILTVGSFLIGLFFALFFKNILDSKKSNKRVQEVEDIITRNKEAGVIKEKTLRELFESDEKSTEEKIDMKEKSIINKDVFLRKYKGLDPDTPTGKERDSKVVKKKIKVSLTSKNE